MRRYFKKHTLGISGTFFFICIKVVFLNRVSILKGQLIDAAVGKIEMRLREVLVLFSVFLLAYLAGSFLLGIIRYATKMNIVKDLKDDFLTSSLLRNRAAIRELDVSKSVSSYTAEMNLVDLQYLTMGGNLIEYIVNILVTLTSIALIDWRMSIVSLAVYVVPVFFTKTQQNKLTKAQKRFQAENDQHTDSFLQKLKGVEAIKNYHIEGKIFDLFNSSLSKLVKEDIRRSETRARTNGMSSALTYVSQAIIAGLSVFFVFRGEISAGNFVSIFALSSAISGQIYWLARSVEAVISARPAVKSVLDYIDVPQKNSDPVPARPVQDTSLVLQVDDLSLNYDDRTILDGLNLAVRKGEKVLVLGASGSGKSSLMSLIAGYLRPDGGDIYLAEEDRSSLISMVEQDAFIFSGTLEDNLFCEDITDDAEIAELLRTLGLSTLQEEGQDVAERGRNLSGGERKRLSLARGFLRDSEIFILDEPLANVDAENIERIEDLILGIQNRTVILISHQVSDRLYGGVDTVYALDDGKLRCLKSRKDNFYQNDVEKAASRSKVQAGNVCDVGCV
ncbi:MAG TPA: ABC transporter ATP-binding protein [Clostridiaceae bacterium]|nr:ABC transporter ATP-binding protein [Clostridiaceae bacterium]